MFESEEEVAQTETAPKSMKAVAYQHMFPGANFDRLPPLDARNVAGLPKRMLYDAAVRRGKLAKGEVFSERVDFVPDQVTVGFEMSDMDPIDGELPPEAFIHLLKPGETLGGVCQKRYIIEKNARLMDKVARVGGSPFEIATGRAVGVLKDGKPGGYIFFTGGPTTVAARPASAPAGA